MTGSDILADYGLRILGGFRAGPDDPLLRQDTTLILLGPDDARFWRIFTASPEYADGAPDPIDRWSRRVIEKIARDQGGTAYFPFGGPPHYPFYDWALRTGRAHPSPIRFLVHPQTGLWASFRGAVAVQGDIDIPPPLASPCATCVDRPCLSACPVRAFAGDGYDGDACKGHIADTDTAQCRSMGCAARRACPVSQKAGRDPAQSALHMRSFLT